MTTFDAKLFKISETKFCRFSSEHEYKKISKTMIFVLCRFYSKQATYLFFGRRNILRTVGIFRFV